MFKNRALQVKMVKTNSNDQVVNELKYPMFTPERINHAAKDYTREAAKVLVAGIIVTRAYKTICEITLLTVQSRIK